MKNKELKALLSGFNDDCDVEIAALIGKDSALPYPVIGVDASVEGKLYIGYDHEEHLTVLESKVTPAEAVFAFAAWLSTRSQLSVFSKTTVATMAAELAGQFNDMQGFDAPGDYFSKKLKPYVDYVVEGLEPVITCNTCGGYVSFVLYDATDLLSMHQMWTIHEGKPMCPKCRMGTR